MMLVNATDSNEEISGQVSLEQKAVQFACTKNGPIVNPILFKIGDKFVKWDVGNKWAFCAFTLSTVSNRSITSVFEPEQAYPTLKFTIGSTENINRYGAYSDDFWNFKGVDQCNPEHISSIITPSDEYIQDPIDTYASSPIDCLPSKILIITRDNGQQDFLTEGNQLFCAIRNWRYRVNSSITQVPQTEKINVVCGEKSCTLCTELAHFESPGWSKPNNSDTSEKCMIRTCPNSQWILEDYRILNGTMECKQDAENERNSTWYLKTSNDSIRVEKAACFNRNICWERQSFTESCPGPVDCTKRIEKPPVEAITCEEGYKLRWNYGVNITNTDQITCDFRTGNFVDSSLVHVRTGSNIICYKVEKNVTVPVAPKNSLVWPIAGGVGGLLLLCGLIAGAVIMYRRWRRSHPRVHRRTRKEVLEKIAKLPKQPHIDTRMDCEWKRREVPQEMDMQNPDDDYDVTITATTTDVRDGHRV